MNLQWNKMKKEQMQHVLALQEEIALEIPKGIFCKSKEKELLTGECYVMEDDKGVAAFLHVIPAPLPSEDLGALVGDKPGYGVLDTIFVHPRMRGMGIQRKAIQWSKTRCAQRDGGKVYATVSPENVHSLHNFLCEDFKVVKTMDMYEGVRHIVCWTQI